MTLISSFFYFMVQLTFKWSFVLHVLCLHTIMLPRVHIQL